MITYAGLGRIISGVAGALSAKLPPGSPVIAALAAALRETAKLDQEDRTGTGSETYLRARGLEDRGLWRHRCGNVGLGSPVTDLPPEYCEVCLQSGGWERLYVNSSERTES